MSALEWFKCVAFPPTSHRELDKAVISLFERRFERQEMHRRVPPLVPRETSLLAPGRQQLASISPGPPILMVAIDTEAEFDWNGPFLRTNTSVRNLRNQWMAQEIFDRMGVRPVYLVDYAVSTQPEGFKPIQEIAASGRCEIGAHLHPWITPPFAEGLGVRTSFSQNLPAWLQRRKLACLTDAITSTFGVAPLCYRAGRLGVGEEVGEILEALGYQIDMSVQPGIDMRGIHGPDFRRAHDRPYWFGPGQHLLEIPANFAFTGIIPSTLSKSLSIQVYRQISKPGVDRLYSLGLFARLHLIERIPMSPEGSTLPELRRLTRDLASGGTRVFVFSYHSSSLLPGSTEYVRSTADLLQFRNTIEGYLEFFLGDIGGICMTPTEFRSALVGELPSLADGTDPPGYPSSGKNEGGAFTTDTGAWDSSVDAASR